MQIVIRSQGLELTPELHEHVERRVRFAFDWASRHVTEIAVRLSDLNGPRGGEDKRCQVVVTLSGVAEVVIEDTQAELLVAIDRAVGRAGRTLARRLERRREHRSGSQDVAAPPGVSVAVPADTSP